MIEAPTPLQLTPAAAAAQTKGQIIIIFVNARGSILQINKNNKFIRAIRHIMNTREAVAAMPPTNKTQRKHQLRSNKNGVCVFSKL